MLSVLQTPASASISLYRWKIPSISTCECSGLFLYDNNHTYIKVEDERGSPPAEKNLLTARILPCLAVSLCYPIISHIAVAILGVMFLYTTKSHIFICY